jgi:hypothetical protein
MQRRTFLLTLASGLYAIACDDDSDSESAGVPPQKNGSTIVYTSSRVDGHTHTFMIGEGALVSPLPTGTFGPTTSAEGHTHTVTISADDLRRAGAGQEVKITTSSTGHTHTFTIVKV